MLKSIDISLYKDEKLIKQNNNIKVNYNKFSNTISYIDDVLTQIEIKNDILIFKRMNDEYEFALKITNNTGKCSYKLVKENMMFDIKCLYASYKINKNIIEIVYNIETDTCENKIIIVKK